MDFQMVYNPEVTHHVSDNFNVKVKSGASLAVRNTLTGLSMTMPDERKDLWELLLQQMREIDGRNAEFQSIHAPNAVFYQPFAFWLEPQGRLIMFTILFGLIARGQLRMGQRRGDYITAVVYADELEDAARKIYHTNRMIELVTFTTSGETESSTLTE